MTIHVVLSGWPPLRVSLALMGVSALVTLGVVVLVWTVRRRPHIAALRRRLNDIASENKEVRAILASLDVGVIAYGGDERILTRNRMADALLPVVPDRFEDFLTVYGEKNGMKASLLLGTPVVSGVFAWGERTLDLRVRRPVSDEHILHGGPIVTVRDISAQEREEAQRKAFVANVSHELKTPLTTIKTYSESLLDWGLDEKSTSALKKDMQRIYDDSIRMERLIEDLLLLSSLDSRGYVLRIETIDFARLVRQTTERMQLLASSHNVHLASTVMANIPPVFGDRAALERIVTNLIMNAIKYTDAHGQVNVYVGTIVDDVYVKVKDTGHGIAPEHHQRIFTRFFRVDTTGSRRFGGTGLGLSIVRELADLHRGRVELKSALGYGSEFTFLLPSQAKVVRDAHLALAEGNRPVDAIGKAALEHLVSHDGDDS